jgi:hypothetical protein
VAWDQIVKGYEYEKGKFVAGTDAFCDRIIGCQRVQISRLKGHRKERASEENRNAWTGKQNLTSPDAR